MDQLRMVSWSNNSYPNPVINLRFKIPTFLPSAKVVQLKGRTYKNL